MAIYFFVIGAVLFAVRGGNTSGGDEYAKTAIFQIFVLIVFYCPICLLVLSIVTLVEFAFIRSRRFLATSLLSSGGGLAWGYLGCHNFALFSCVKSRSWICYTPQICLCVALCLLSAGSFVVMRNRSSNSAQQ